MRLKNSIPVVMYHHISDEGGGLNISPRLFEEHLMSLRRDGWKTLKGDEFIEFIQRDERPDKCVLLTFDDGFADNYVYAYPLLKKYGMKAVLFVTTSFIDDIDIKRDKFKQLPHEEAWRLVFTERRSEVMCTWNELKEMEESGTFDIQAHSHSHNTPLFIREKRYTELENDLWLCKKTIEGRLSKDIHHLSWPKGHYDQKGIEIAERMGFKALYTTKRGQNTADNLREIRRLAVKRGGRWLINRLNIYSSTFLSRIYLSLRWD